MTESELKLDLEEINKLLGLVQQQRIQKCLALEKAKIERELQEVKKPVKSLPRNVVPTVTIKSYAWDQSDKFIKIYLSNLNGIQSIDASNVTLNTDIKPHTVDIKNLKGKNYTFLIPKLAHETALPTIKVKSDMLLIMLKKENSETWKVLTDKEQKAADAKDFKAPAMDKNEDPQASMMSMMKKMYDDGDDDMKRTIAKAWTESREKGGGGMMPPM